VAEGLRPPGSGHRAAYAGALRTADLAGPSCPGGVAHVWGVRLVGAPRWRRPCRLQAAGRTLAAAAAGPSRVCGHAARLPLGSCRGGNQLPARLAQGDCVGTIRTSHSPGNSRATKLIATQCPPGDIRVVVAPLALLSRHRQQRCHDGARWLAGCGRSGAADRSEIQCDRRQKGSQQPASASRQQGAGTDRSPIDQ
jgi:hypothetical protein